MVTSRVGMKGIIHYLVGKKSEVGRDMFPHITELAVE